MKKENIISVLNKMQKNRCTPDYVGDEIKTRYEGGQKEACYIRLKSLNNGQYEISDIRSDYHTNNRSWQKTNVFNYKGQIEEMEVCAEGNGCLWIRTESLNHILYLPRYLGSEEIVGFTPFGCWADRCPIKGLVVPEGYKYIGNKAFMAYPTLEFVSLPDGLYKIEQSAFTHCTNLRHVFLGEIKSIFMRRHPLTIIEGEAFENCNPSMTFYIPSGYKGRPYDRNRFPRVEIREQNEERIVATYNKSCTNIEISCGRIAIARDFAVVLQENE